MIGWLTEHGPAWIAFHAIVIGLGWTGLAFAEALGAHRTLRTTRFFAGLFVLAPCLLIGMSGLLEMLGAPQTDGAWDVVAGYLPVLPEASGERLVSGWGGAQETVGSTAISWTSGRLEL